MDLNDPRPTDSRNARLLYDCAKGVAFVSTVAIAVILILFLVAWFHVKNTPPTDTETMARLIEAAKRKPDDTKLVAELRALDVVARRAQFQWFHFSKRGGVLVIIGAACLFGSLKLMGSLRKRLPEPSTETPTEDRAMARWAVLGGMGILTLFLFVFMEKGLPTFHDVVEPAIPVDIVSAPAPKLPISSAVELENQWTAFRGHGGLGSTVSASLPEAWDGMSGTGLIWKAAVPLPGFNSPIIWKDRLYCTGADGSTRKVYCFDATTGTLVWEVAVKAQQKPADADVSEDTGFAAATMACNGAYVYAIFGGGELVCLDLDGTTVWEKRFGFPRISYGYSSSIRCFRDRIILQQDYAPHRRVISLNAHTGELVWQTPRTTLANADAGDGMQECWSTPVVVTVKDAPLLVLNGNPEVRAYDPITGKSAWSWNGMGGEVATSPAMSGDILLLSQEYAKTAALNVADGSVIWEDDQLDMPDVCSPVIVGDLAFLPTAGGQLTCVSLADGKVKWAQEFEEGFYASPVVVNDRLLLINRKGKGWVVKAADTYQVISTHALGEDCVATPAPVGKRLYVRGVKHVYCFGK